MNDCARCKRMVSSLPAWGSSTGVGIQNYSRKRGVPIKKSRYTMVFPVKNRYMLINGLSGAVSLVSKETAQQFFDGNMTEELKPFFTHLTPEEEYEKAKTLCTFLMKKAAQCADGTLAVTCDCNLHCTYCYEIWAKEPEIMRTVMDEYTVDKAFEALEVLNRECTEKKIVTLSGGEPLMRKNKDIIKYILKKGDDLGYYFAVITNGIELHQFLEDILSVPLEYVQVTLDGPRSLHDKRRIFKKGKGTFDTIAENIDRARTQGIPLAIRTNVDAEVLSSIEDMASFFRERGWVKDPGVTFSLSVLYDQHMDCEKTKEYMGLYEKVLDLTEKQELSFFDFHSFLRHFRKLRSLCGEPPRFWPAFWHCGAVSRRYILDPFGDVYSCPSTIGWKEQRIGVYIPELSFNENYDKWKNRTIFVMEKCTKCELALVCGGDCGYASLLNENDLYTPVCTTTEKLVQDYVETYRQP